LKVLKGKKEGPHSTLFWEHEGSRAVREQDWKLVAELNAPWELYHLKSDRTETNNLAPKYPEKVKQLEKNTWNGPPKLGFRTGIKSNNY